MDDNLHQLPPNPFHHIKNIIGSDRYVLLFIAESGSTGYSFGNVSPNELAHLKTILEIATQDIYRDTYGGN